MLTTAEIIQLRKCYVLTVHFAQDEEILSFIEYLPFTRTISFWDESVLIRRSEKRTFGIIDLNKYSVRL